MSEFTYLGLLASRYLEYMVKQNCNLIPFSIQIWVFNEKNPPYK